MHKDMHSKERERMDYNVPGHPTDACLSVIRLLYIENRKKWGY